MDANKEPMYFESAEQALAFLKGIAVQGGPVVFLPSPPVVTEELVFNPPTEEPLSTDR